MTNREFFVATVKDELPRFERVLRAVASVPKEKWDYRPDPRSKTAFELVTHTFGSEAGMFVPFLKTGKIDFGQTTKTVFQSVEEVAAVFKKGLTEANQKVELMSEEDWDSEAKMMAGEKVEWATTKGNMAWGLLLDFIHHRGQLSTYLRPMGGKVPSIYGPSADSQG